MDVINYLRSAITCHVQTEHPDAPRQLNLVWGSVRADPLRVWMPVPECDRCRNMFRLLCESAGSTRVWLKPRASAGVEVKRVIVSEPASPPEA